MFMYEVYDEHGRNAFLLNAETLPDALVLGNYAGDVHLVGNPLMYFGRR
jgi:hypothetical protein